MKKRLFAVLILIIFLLAGLLISSYYKSTVAGAKQVLTYINSAEPRYLDPAKNTA
ncbi:hypothetical protein [Caldicellulosiruptor saccharolyticus]|uniref:hypothetical protein n=1 Tax=Caldicellulosiruptor saccharolyticus TaxID=44001 RepID=UPI001650C67F|nr:hypothetical protein [Caldicellulosiruptor saccharolyticus]